MSAEPDLHELLEARLHDVPELRWAVLDDVFAQTRTMPQRHHRWPLDILERHTERMARRSATDGVAGTVPMTRHRQVASRATRSASFRFALASVAVALLGGLLLVGVLTTRQGDQIAPAALIESPGPLTTAGMLASMAVDEIEPGVYRVTHDGVRDLRPGELEQLVVGRDGSVWTFGIDGIRRLGSDQPDGLKAGAELPPHDSFEIGPDGTLWVDGAQWGADEWDGLASFDGETWTSQRPKDVPAGFRPWGLRVAPDGSVWVLLADVGVWQPGSALLAHYDGDGWDITDFVPRALPALFAGDSASVWAVEDSALPTIYRFDGDRWQEEDTPAGFPGQWLLVVGPDDTLWTLLWPGEPADFGSSPAAMAYYDGATWQTWDEDYFPVQDEASLLSALRPTDAGPDGSLWSQVLWGSWVSPFSPEWSEPECDGVARFDGVAVSRYLEGYCLTVLEAASDGSVWLLAGRDGPDRELYVITPETVSLRG